MKPLVVCVGLTTIDLVHTVDALPAPNSKITALSQALDVGGPACNAARVAAALGCQVRLVTAIGDTPLGRVARDILEGSVEVIDLADDYAIPVSSVMVTADGERTVVSRNTADLTNARTPDPAVCEQAGVVLHDGHLLPASIHLASATRTWPERPYHLLDGGSWKAGLPDLLPLLDGTVISGNFAEPGFTAIDSLERLAQAGITDLARTRGHHSVQIRAAGAEQLVPVPHVDAVDTTGAGDVLHGALAAFMAHGTRFTEALTEAVTIASRSVTLPGVMSWTTYDAHPPVT